jgi:calcineurin-like phosphoesterase family protein
MDETLIRNWNRVVGPVDLVFHLGDFSLGLGDIERVTWIFERLHGRKRLILGNHDIDRKGELHPSLAGLAWDAPPTHAAETTDGGQRIYLHHYACRTWPGQHHGAYHFYGHSHGNLPGVGRCRDVGVDTPDVGFTPRTFAELTTGMTDAI